MAVSTDVLDPTQKATLRSVCDTFIPSLAEDPDPGGYWARAASDLAVPEFSELALAALPAESLQGVRDFLDFLAAAGFGDLPLDTREQTLLAFMDAGPEGLAAINLFKTLTLLLFVGMVDPTTGQNPNWELTGYPGPLTPPPQAPKPIRPLELDGAEQTLTADVVVVGSGAGGGVIAGKLAGAGKDVVVLEAGGYYNEADFNQQELWAYQNLYRAGGLAASADGSISLLTGSNLGGGTTVNWTNCIRTRDGVRAEWAAAGLEGVDGPDYGRHLDAVWERLGVNDQCSDYNDPHLRLEEGCQKLGYAFRRVTRNADPATYDPASAAYMGFGDQSGSKLGTLKTYLEDAYEHGARFLVRCRADRVLVENGRAAGVEATATRADGSETRVVIRAPQVVVACGALDSPSLLLRSGIGGPACGDYLRLHPATAVSGIYDEPQKPWWGPPQAGLSDQFADLEDGYGFLIECSHASPALGAAATPWESGRQVKSLLLEGRYGSPFVFLIRDRGHGRVTLDATGNSVVDYHVEDEVDDRSFRRGLRELVLLHHAAGARAIYTLHTRYLRWDRGEDIEAFAQRVNDAPLDPGEHATFSLHHMGSCRMGADPATSVAGPWGELHDCKGVWIGDGSAFPTASGTNPMISIMALAHRTAEAMLAADS